MYYWCSKLYKPSKGIMQIICEAYINFSKLEKQENKEV
jgi:hypothetical protein